jgi:CubicO group peptidase (beta-lactamase class C family)
MIMTTCYTLLLEVIHVVAEKSWGDFVEERIMEPLEMNHSAASFVRLKDSTNIIAPHVP